MPVHPTPRPGIMEISPYVGGRSTADGHANTIKLSSNESAVGPSPKAQAAYRELAGTLHRYPDGGATDLRTALGALHGIDPDRIVCGNGSDELLQLLAHAYAGPGDEVIYSRHGFLVYPLATLAVGATPVVAHETDYTADVDAILSLVTERTRIVFLANPNNPTGTYIPKGELRRLWGGLPEHVVLVVDSAYAEFVTTADYDPGLELAGMAPNVVMTRTFSKAYGLAALRLGWAYAAPAVIDVIHRIRGPFNANAAALAAALRRARGSGSHRPLAAGQRGLPRCARRQARGVRSSRRAERLQLPAGALSGRAGTGRRGGRPVSQRTRDRRPADGALPPRRLPQDHGGPGGGERGRGPGARSLHGGACGRGGRRSGERS